MTAQPDHAGVIPDWTIGWRIQRALGHAGIPAGDIAVDLQVSRGTVSRWLNDKGLPPRGVYLERIAELTGVPFLWLCHGDMRPCGPRLVVTNPDSVTFPQVRHGVNNMHCSGTKIAA
jgi:hypothetical protein